MKSAPEPDVGDQSGHMQSLLVDDIIGHAVETCHDHLHSEHSDQYVLAITYPHSPSDRIENWRKENGDLPEQMGIISLTSFPGTPFSDRVEKFDGLPVYFSIDHPAELTGVSMSISSYLSRWEDEIGDDSSVEKVFCFDSITSLLQYTDVDTAYQFLDYLTGEMRRVGTRGHYHMTPEAHDPETVARISTLFDDELVSESR